MRYPRQIIIQGVEPTDARLVFVENGGVRIDNAGPFPLKEARRLRDWLARFCVAAAASQRERRRR